MKTSLLESIAVFGLALLTMTAYADQKSDGRGLDMGAVKMHCKGTENMKDMKMDSMDDTKAQNSDMAEGVVEAVDRSGKEIMLKHGPIKSRTVEMSPMTMMFAVTKSSLLSKVKVGDKVQFQVENIKGTATITALQVQ